MTEGPKEKPSVRSFYQRIGAGFGVVPDATTFFGTWLGGNGKNPALITASCPSWLMMKVKNSFTTFGNGFFGFLSR